jgi:hypothetical protein
MLIEDFLMRKNLSGTLDAFRSEWQRPGESSTTFSWYEVCMKLRLHEILDKAPARETVLENLATTLTTEASLRMRAPMEVAVAGLATMPVTKPLPGTIAAFDKLEDESFARSQISKEESLGLDVPDTGMNFTEGGGGTTDNAARMSKRLSKPPPIIASKMGMAKTAGGMRAEHMFNPNKGKPSAENWIPETTRMKSLGRDLAVAEENLGDIIKREVQSEREMRQFKTTIFQKAQVEESLGSKKKVMCGCCMRYYSYVNLPLKVSNKAVVDLRKNWSNGARGWWSQRDEKLGRMPRCYNDVSVCHFCSQFFLDQEAYRPSMEKLEYEVRKEAFFDTKRKEKEKWDPVRMLEKDRAEWQALVDAQDQQEVASEGGNSVGGNSIQSVQSNT